MRSGWDPLFFLPKPESPVGPNVINKSCERVRLALMSGEPAPLLQVCTESLYRDRETTIGGAWCLSECYQ